MINFEESWPSTREVRSWDELCDASYAIPGEMPTSEPSVAWRGMPRPEWTLRSSIDRILRSHGAPTALSYNACLAREAAVVSEFVHRAAPYATIGGESEVRGFLQNRLEPVIGPMIVGRHYGLPTRIIDWTNDWKVAAYFACIEHSDADGVIWWFAHETLEKVCAANWESWGVPTYREALKSRAELKEPADSDPRWGQRCYSAVAFTEYCRPWLGKIHPTPFRRLGKQSAFMTICGRLLTDHNDAIDELPNSSTIERGRIVIHREAKGEIVEKLHALDVHATSLDYPGIDRAAIAITEELRRR